MSFAFWQPATGIQIYADALQIFLPYKSESWQRVIEHITGPETGIERVLLVHLTEPSRRTPMWFPEAPTLPYYSAEGEIGESSLELRGDAVRRPIKYRFMAEPEYESMKPEAESQIDEPQALLHF